MANGEKFSILNASTLVPIGVVLTVAMAIAGGVVWLNSELKELQFQVTSVQRAMGRVEASVSKLNDGTVTLQRLRTWAKLLQSENKGVINVPIPGD